LLPPDEPLLLLLPAGWLPLCDEPLCDELLLLLLLAAWPLPAPIRKIAVPQTGHTPFVAGRPFFIVTSCGSLISRLARHFTQYASAAIQFTSSLQ
jgi:hypothetical protein